MTVDSFLSTQRNYDDPLNDIDSKLRAQNMVTVTEYKQREVSDPCHDSAPKPPPTVMDMLNSTTSVLPFWVWVLIFLFVVLAVAVVTRMI